MVAPRPVARAVVDGSGIEAALAVHDLRRGTGWPHPDTADALRPLADYGLGNGTFLAVDDADNVIGDCGWFGPPDADGSVTIGYGIAPAYRRKGLGTQAVRALLEWVWDQPSVTCVAAEVLVGNEPSLRLLGNLGFSELRREGAYSVMSVSRPGDGRDHPGRLGSP